MSELGRSVFSAVEFLTEFHRDVSRLVVTVEEQMTNEGLAPLYGGTAFWNRSITYNSPTSWMPRWVARLYSLKADNSSKGEEKAPWFVFFNVYFTPKHIGEPVAAWGFGKQKSKQRLGPPIERLLIANDGPDFLRAIPAEDWMTVDEMPDRLSDFEYQARAVVELCDAQTVDEIVVVPLVAQVARLGKSRR